MNQNFVDVDHDEEDEEEMETTLDNLYTSHLIFKELRHLRTIHQIAVVSTAGNCVLLLIVIGLLWSLLHGT